MKTDAPQSVGFQKLRKLLRHIMRLDEITNLIDTDITCILFVVRLPAEPPVVILLRFDGKQPFLDERHQRKGSHTGLGFGGIRRHENVLIVEVHRCNGVPDDDGVVLKINGIPFKTDGFATSQTVESTEQNRQLQFGSLGDFKKLVHFVRIKEAADEMIFLGALNLVSRIRRDQIQLDCVLQSFVNVRVVMDMLNAKGKKILKSSYSVLQDDFFHFMRAAGYTDVERGERGSTEEHLTVTQFKVQAEQQRLEAVTGQVAQAEQSLEDAKSATEKQKKKLEALQKETKTAKTIALTVQDIEAMGKKSSITGNVSLTPDQCDTLKRYAVNGIIANADNKRLKEKLASVEKTASIWKQRYDALNEKYQELKKKAQPFLDALEIASERVRAFLDVVLSRGKETHEHKQPTRRRGHDMEH